MCDSLCICPNLSGYVRMCVDMYEIVRLGGNLCKSLLICGNTNEYV